jgi:hypothetical protein
MKRNSISKTIKQLRIFVKDRIKRKIIPPLDMTDFKAPEEETDATYLNFKEISQFYHSDLSPYPNLISDQNYLSWLASQVYGFPIFLKSVRKITGMTCYIKKRTNLIVG